MSEQGGPDGNESCPLLLTPPHCIAEVGDAIAVEGPLLHSVQVSHEFYSKESYFGSEEQGEELQDRSGRDPLTHVALRNAGEQEVQGGFDVCNEYGYNCTYSADDGDDDVVVQCTSQQGDPLLSLEVANAPNPLEDSTASQEQAHAIYLLGKSYDAIHDYAPRRNDETSLFWFTYRFDFPEIVPYRITTDAGWGCMLRSAQMMLGQTLRIHYKGRDWRPPQAITQRRQDKFIVSMLTWFC